MNFKPLLAPNKDPLSYETYFEELRYPLLCSPKYDGIRCIIKNGFAYSRSGKILPSYQVQDEFGKYEHFDGELIVGSPTDLDVYNRTQSHIMSREKPAEIFFWVFDYTHPNYLNRPYIERYDEIMNIEIETLHEKNFKGVPSTMVTTLEDLLKYENECLKAGFEGIMMRDPYAPYKNGRGTFKEGIIYKLKRFQDAEATIIGFKELMLNENTLGVDELGYAKRSTSKEGLVPGNTLGAFVVEFENQILDIAPGVLTHEDRKAIWEDQEFFLNKILKFRFFAHGVKDKPRFPRYIGFRTLEDM